MLCPSCGRDNPSDAKFCNECGAKQDTPLNTTLAETPIPSEDSGILTSGSFVGRQRELAELQAALNDALSGRGRLVMLAGEPGIGKTRTAQELASFAETRGTQVLWGRCYEEAGAPPYWPWVQPIRSYSQQRAPEQLLAEMGPGAADIAEIVPEIRHKLTNLEKPPSLEPEQARFRLFNSITTFFKNAAHSQPLLLVLDDLHWADKPSLLLLQFLALEMGRSRLLVVGTYRDVELSRQHPLSETLAQLSREPVFRRELLRGLSREDTGDFVEVAAGLRPPQGLVESIYLHTEGNPFFMGEVVRLLAEQGELREVDIGESPSIRIPEGVLEVIGQRLNRLSEQCNQTLVTAAVIGREFDFRLLIALSDGKTESQLLDAIDEGLEAYLIEELPGELERYQFRHALIQETLARELSTSRRVRLHARIAQALEEQYAATIKTHAAELAYHFTEAETLLGTEKLVRFSLLAGEQALTAYAWEEALGHFERALEAKGVPLVGTEPAPDGETAALLSGLGRAQVATLPRFQLGEAVTTLSRAFDYYAVAGEVDRAVAIARSGQINVMVGYPLGTTELLARGLALVPPDSHAAGLLLSRYGWELGRMEGDYEGAQRAFKEALVIAQREGDLTLEVRTLAAAASVDFAHVHYQENVEKSRRAIDLAQRADDLAVELQALEAYRTAGLALRNTGDLEGGRQHAQAGLLLAERLRDRNMLALMLTTNGSLYQIIGDWPTARDYSDRGLAVSPTDVTVLASRVLLEYEVGDFVQGEAHLERLLEAMRRAVAGPSAPYGYAAMVIPLVARITGRMKRFDIAVGAAEAVLSSPSAVALFATIARSSRALMAVQLDDGMAAGEQYTTLVNQQGTILTALLTSVDRLLGLVAQTMGNLDQATSHFEDALAFCRKAGYRPELAWTCCDYADCLLQDNGDGNHAKALTLLDEALAISTDLSMRPLMKRVTERVERIQAQPLPALAYPDGLTHREVEVLALVAAGKSNADIAEELVISPNTVVRHVSNILAKTGSSNRTEAALYASQNGLTG